jgi:hypothetical protein
MRITSAGNVGIGMTTPAQKLVVNGNIRTDVGSGGTLTLFETNATRANMFIAGADASGAYIDSSYSSGGSGAVLFRTIGTERMRIDSSGNVGIGTATPRKRLEVTGTAGANAIQSQDSQNGTNFLRMFSDVGSGAAINVNTGGVIRFAQSAEDFSGFTERMRIDSSGNLLVGTTSATGRSGVTTKFAVSAPSGSDTAYLLQTSNAYFALTSHVNTTSGTRYHIGFGDGTTWTERGSISTDGTGTSYNTSSDYRLKEIDGPIANSGTYIDALKPVQGSWKADGSRFIGLLAHEVQEVSETTIATGEKDGEKMQAMDYSAPELIANLIAELQSVRARLAELEGK